MKASLLLLTFFLATSNVALAGDFCRNITKIIGTSAQLTPKLGAVVIVSGPSGAGKTTVVREVVKQSLTPVHVAVSVTTRNPRAGETDGKDYHFWTRARFETAVEGGEFVEWADVHGNFYGTLKSEIDPYRLMGHSVVLVIDVKGARAAKAIYPETLLVFLRTSSEATFEERLRARGTETEASIQLRLENARRELEHEKEYDRTILNDDLSTAVADLKAIVEHLR